MTTNDKSVDGVLGSRTWAAGWKAQTNPLSYAGTPDEILYLPSLIKVKGYYNLFAKMANICVWNKIAEIRESK